MGRGEADMAMSALTPHRRAKLDERIAHLHMAIGRLEAAYDQDIADEQMALGWVSAAAAMLEETAMNYGRWLESQPREGAS